MEEKSFEINDRDLKKLNSKKGLVSLFSRYNYSVERTLRYLRYLKSLEKHQEELIKLQTWVSQEKKRVIVIFEGRDAAGKGGAIRRITERLNPRLLRVVALPKPTDEESTQWYFKRYVEKFPNEGEIVFFDRSWYNRAVVEPVNGFCSEEQYQVFMSQVCGFEKMIKDSGIILVKIYMSISKKEQNKRFKEIKSDPLKQWKMTEVDKKAQELWNEYTSYKDKMFFITQQAGLPFEIIRANRKTTARLEAIKHLLDSIPYDKEIKI